MWQVKKDHFVQAYMGYTPYKFQLDAWVRCYSARMLPPTPFCHLPALQGGPDCWPCPETWATCTVQQPLSYGLASTAARRLTILGASRARPTWAAMTS